MRVVLQRVASASVAVDAAIIGEIGPGLLVLAGISHQDTPATAAALAEKIAHLRIFEDDAGKMNRSALEIGAQALVISQFTLYADTAHGRRPAFLGAAPPDQAAPLIERFVARLRELGLVVATGRFGAHMRVTLVNDGPVTLILEGAP